MPRSSRHKSSKHSSRDARDYSDSDRDLSLKDKKTKEEASSTRVVKDSGSGEKRKPKHGSHERDLIDSGKEFVEEYTVSASKKRKDRSVDDNSAGGDRWTGGQVDPGEKNESEREGRPKPSSDLKSKSSRRHDGLSDKREEIEDIRKSRKSKLDRESNSSRRESKEGGSERERKGKEGKGEKLGDGSAGEAVDKEASRKHGTRFGSGENDHRAKRGEENAASKGVDGLQKSEHENEPENRSRGRRDGSTDLDKHGDSNSVINDKHLLFKDDISRDGRHKDENYRDKYQDDKWRDELPLRDSTNSRPDDKHAKDEKDIEEIAQKSYKLRDRDREPDRDRDRKYDRDSRRDRDYDHDREYDHEPRRGRDRDYNREPRHDRDRESRRDRDREHDHEQDREPRRDREREREQNRKRDWHGDRDPDRYRDCDPARYRDRDRSSNLINRTGGYKDSRGKKRSLDDYGDHSALQSRNVKVHHPEAENRSSSSGKIDVDAEKGRSRIQHSHKDTGLSNNQHNHEADYGNDEYRRFDQVNSRYVDSATEQGLNSDRVFKCRPSDKIEDSHFGEVLIERSSSSKASPMVGFVEGSPSSTSIDRRGMSRNGPRWSLDVDERGWKSSAPNEARESAKPLADMPSQADPFFPNKSGHTFSSSIPLQSAFRLVNENSSLRGSVEEDSRVNSSTPYRRMTDSNMGRGLGNTKKGTNWSSLVPNGYIPFQPGPPPGGFQGLMSPFSSPLFGVRPSHEVNHSGIPYHFPDADRFSSHVRPLGWQTMVDGSVAGGLPHFHGWDGINGAFRSEGRTYRVPEWDQKKQSVEGRGWESSADPWKGQSGDSAMGNLPSSQKEDYPSKATNSEVLAQSDDQKSENSHGLVKSTEMDRSSGSSRVKQSSISPTKSYHEKAAQRSKISRGDDSLVFVAYLSKLDISTELVHPELYDQCMSLLELEPKATSDKNITKNLEVDWKHKIRVAKPSVSHFSTAKNSVYERAMSLYKKQNMENGGPLVSSGERVDTVEFSDAKKLEEHSLEATVKKREESIPISDHEKADELVLTSVQEISADLLVGTAGQEEKEQAYFPTTEISEKNPGLERLRSGKKDQGMTSDSDKGGGKDDLLSLDLENFPSTPKCDEMGDGGCSGKISVEGVEPQLDAVGGPLPLGKSTESESVILSRIHHSPKNTH